MILPKDSEHRTEVLRLFRTLGERMLLIHFPIQTSHTLELLQQILDDAAEREQV